MYLEVRVIHIIRIGLQLPASFDRGFSEGKDRVFKMLGAWEECLQTRYTNDQNAPKVTRACLGSAAARKHPKSGKKNLFRLGMPCLER